MACGESLPHSKNPRLRSDRCSILHVKRIEAHVCICFVALKVYKELERLLRLSAINMSVDKVLALAQTIVTIQLTLPQKQDYDQQNHAHETPINASPRYSLMNFGVRRNRKTKSGKAIIQPYPPTPVDIEPMNNALWGAPL